MALQHPNARKGSSNGAADRASLAHLLQMLADPQKAVNWQNQDVDIDRDGKKIILPAEPGPMPIPVAIEALERKLYDEEQETTVNEEIYAFPLEAAVAFVAAMEELYGWASPVPTPGFFGPTPPHFISVQTDVDKWIQVPWGSFRIPGVENDITIDSKRNSRGEPYLLVYGTVRKRERHVLLELAAKTREILKTRSIYRGKAIHIVTDSKNQLDINNPPTFIDVRNVDPAELIMNKDVQLQIDTSINAPIRFTDKVRAAGIPLKRGVLLEGRYGTGKTMATRVTAKHCVDNGWTFITVDRGDSLKEALSFAQRYQPCVVFCEDIDRTTNTRDEKANDLLNTIDGILSKSAEVMVVLTTNHVEKIEPAMLRPGRLDAVITVLPPDAEAVGRLIRLYSRGLLAAGETLDEVGAELAGNIPAVIREVVERSKLAMIAQSHDVLRESDLLISARGMKAHLALLEPKPVAKSDEEMLGMALAKIVNKNAVPFAGQVVSPQDLEKARRQLASDIGSIAGMIHEAAEGAKSTVKNMETIAKKATVIDSNVEKVKRKLSA